MVDKIKRHASSLGSDINGERLPTGLLSSDGLRYDRWLLVNFGALIDIHARSSTERAAIYADGTAISYRELRQETNRFANLLDSRGIDEGDRVAFYTPNAPEYVVGYFGALKHGAIPTPVNMRFTEREVAFVLDDVTPELLFVHGSLVENVPDTSGTSVRDVYVFGPNETTTAHRSFDAALDSQPGPFDAIPRQNDETANIVYTSGTTGDPKGVEHHHGYLHAFAAGRADFFELSADDIGLILSPLFHVSGQGIMLIAAYLGCPMVLVPEWDIDRVFEAIERRQVTFMHLITTVVTDIVSQDETYFDGVDTDSIDVVMTGGGSIDPDRIRWFESVVGGHLSEGYGRTEGGTAYNPLDERKLGSNGVPLENSSRIRVVDPESSEPLPAGTEGEIRVTGDGVSNGYYNRPDANADLFDDYGWMKTDDAGYFDDDGYLYFTGRMDDVIKTGGENVRPKEVEDVLLEHPGVAEVVVIGRPHDRWGEQIVAVVVPAGPDVTAEELVDHCRQDLAGFKVPRDVLFVDELPKQGNRKVSRDAVRSLVEEHVD